MPKKMELLNSYSNTNAIATLQRVESAPAAQGGYYTVFYGQEGPRQQSKTPEFTNKLKAEVLRIFPEAKILAEVSPDGYRSLIVYTPQDLEEVVAQITHTTGQKFTRDQREILFAERFELTKWRGHLGNIGQVFITLSGLGLNAKMAKTLFNEPVPTKNKFKDPDKVISSIASVMGNGLNSWFGVQKKPDQERLEVVKSKLNDFILSKGSAHVDQLADSTGRLTHYTWREKPRDPNQKATVFFEQNAGIMSEVLKIFGKYSYFKGGNKRGNDGDRVHGAVSMAAKFVTVLGKDEDPYGVEGKQDWFNSLRQKSNLISGAMEWVANISQFVGAMAEQAKEGKPIELHDGTTKNAVKPSPGWMLVDWNNSYLMHWKKWDFLQLIGALFFTLSLTTKMMAPFTEKKVNLDELNAHSAVGLATADGHVQAQQTAEVATHMLELRAPTGLKMLPEVHKQGLAKTFAGLADMLYTRHEQDITKPPAAASIPAIVPEVAQSKTAPKVAVTEMRDKLKEARERGEGAFAEKFGKHEGSALAVV